MLGVALVIALLFTRVEARGQGALLKQRLLRARGGGGNLAGVPARTARIGMS